MTDRLYFITFNRVNFETAFIIGRYPDEEKMINEWYSDLLLELDDDAKAFNIYLTKMIGFCEAKEDYETCSALLKIKKRIK